MAKKVQGLCHSVPIEALARGLGKGKDSDMNSLFLALKQAFKSLLRIRMLFLVLGPPLLAFGALLILFVGNWQTLLGALTAFFHGTFGGWLESFIGWSEFSEWTAIVFLVLIFIPLAYLLAVLLTSIFAMPLVLKWVGEQEYPELEKKRGGTVVGSILNAFVTAALFVVLFFITLPLWLLPGFQVLLPWTLAAWLNKRVFVYDVLQDYASVEERQLIEKSQAPQLYGMGFILGLLSYIPLAFFFVPVISALAYTYYALNALRDLRKGA